MILVSVSQEELSAHGYVEITHQTEDGEVIIRDESGHLEVFEVRECWSGGWCLEAEDDRYLEFVRGITHKEGLT